PQSGRFSSRTESGRATLLRTGGMHSRREAGEHNVASLMHGDLAIAVTPCHPTRSELRALWLLRLGRSLALPGCSSRSLNKASALQETRKCSLRSLRLSPRSGNQRTCHCSEPTCRLPEVTTRPSKVRP